MARALALALDLFAAHPDTAAGDRALRDLHHALLTHEPAEMIGLTFAADPLCPGCGASLLRARVNDREVVRHAAPACADFQQLLEARTRARA